MMQSSKVSDHNHEIPSQTCLLRHRSRQFVSGWCRSLHDPEILIFDEATSALDGETEKIIQNFIDEMKNKKTIITIAHRLTTIQDSDIIYLLKNGTISVIEKELISEQYVENE